MRYLPILLAAGAAALMAQDTRPAIDNDQVRVLVVTQPPHQKTKLHDHKINRVMIYLQPGKQDFEYPETKKKMVLTWKAGEAKWSPAGGKHIAEIVSDKPVTIVEVELKKPGDPAKKADRPARSGEARSQGLQGGLRERPGARAARENRGGTEHSRARTRAQSRGGFFVGPEDPGDYAGRKEQYRRAQGGRGRLGRSGEAQGRESELRRRSK